MMTYIGSGGNEYEKEKGNFEYKQNTLEKYGRIFSPSEIGKYSCKIKSVCDNIKLGDGKVCDGIVLIYSEYIDSGIIPMALALEEIGITRYGGLKSLFKVKPVPDVDTNTMKSRAELGNDVPFKPAKYIMITGDKRLSPNNDKEIKSATDILNKDGNEIKVILISRAGSEGIDLKFIRQIHILEPWYNMNRIEQIIGRGVRNLSHKDLPFEKRNVEIFLHGTILQNKNIESIDLNVYRTAERKAIDIGKISRILKETATDCLLNIGQTNFTKENFEKILKEPLTQTLSTGVILNNYIIGDTPYTSTCDYLSSCNYSCKPSLPNGQEIKINENTYNNKFIYNNIDKIIYKIKQLMREKFFYNKQELIQRLNIPKQYQNVQIYTALTELIDNKEYIIDKYGRYGYLVNIDELYLFQPLEIKDKNISIYERQTPLYYKPETINIKLNKNIFNNKLIIQDIDNDALSPELPPMFNANSLSNIPNTIPNTIKNKNPSNEVSKILEHINICYTTALNNKILNETKTNRLKYISDDINIIYYTHVGLMMTNIILEYQIPEIIMYEILINIILDNLLYSSKLQLMQYIFSLVSIDENSIISKIKTYFEKKMVVNNNLIGIILFKNTKENEIFILKDKLFVIATPEDKRDLQVSINAKYVISPSNFAHLIGFLTFNIKTNDILYKILDPKNKRNTGTICKNAKKADLIILLNVLLNEPNKYTKENTTNIVGTDICIYFQFLTRFFDYERKNNKRWFLDFETSMMTLKIS